MTRFWSHNERRGVPSVDPYDADDEANSEVSDREVVSEAEDKRQAAGDDTQGGHRGEHGGLEPKVLHDSNDKHGTLMDPNKNEVQVGDETQRGHTCLPAKVGVDQESSKGKNEERYARACPIPPSLPRF